MKEWILSTLILVGIVGLAFLIQKSEFFMHFFGGLLIAIVIVLVIALIKKAVFS